MTKPITPSAKSAAPTKPKSGFTFSNTSKLRMNGVNADLVRVIERALELSTVDFIVLEGMRTRERQAALVKSGASKTMNSRHLIGQAIDIAPMIDGQVRWDWPVYYVLAKAIREAAIELNVRVTWGGVWDKPINDLSDDLAKEVKDYCARHAGSDFLDGPHLELTR